MAADNSHLQSRMIVSRLRSLTATGLLGIITTVAVIGVTLFNVRSQRRELASLQQRLTGASDAFRRFAAQSHWALDATLDGLEADSDGGTARVNFQRSVQSELDSKPDAKVLKPLSELKTSVDRLTGLSDRANDWREQREKISGDARGKKTLQKVRDQISELRRVANSSEGDNLSGEGIAFTARLSELARLVEVLAGEEQIEPLIELRDQQITPTLTSLASLARQIRMSPDHAGSVTEQSIAGLRVAILGKPPATGPSGESEGGLFNLRRDALELRRTRDTLKTESGLLFEHIDQANADFAQSAQGRTAELAERMEKTLSSGWGRTLMFGGLCCGAVCWLGLLITRGIYAQVREIEVQRAEAERGRQSTQKLVLEQQAAAIELEAVHEKLLETSRQAGMAEVATGVLHNVGNVLNSVNVSSTLIAENLRKSRLSHLARVVTLLHDHAADLGNFITTHPSGKQLPAFLAQLNDFLAVEQAQCLKETVQLQKNIEHIKDIVSMQQAYACSSGFLERVDLRESVEDALNINLAAMTRHDVSIVREYSDIPMVLADKHKILQIMVNLVSNAKHAMKDSPAKRLTIRIESDHGEVRAIVRDTGYGIPPENLMKIFAHGFTTKNDGHGFGLHSCANAAREAGGSLQAHSDGPGRGAVFTVSFPANAARAIAA